MLPAIAEPTRFLLIFKSTSALADVFSTDLIMWPGRLASQTTDFPRPSILQKILYKLNGTVQVNYTNAMWNYQLIADGFLSVQ